MMIARSTVKLPVRDNTPVGRMADEEVLCLRVIHPEHHWQRLYPNVWQLIQEFEICLLERWCQGGLVGIKDYLLATQTSCSNGLRIITGHGYVSPPFNQLSEMELYLSEHLVELLHQHFFGEARIEPHLVEL